MTLNIVTFCAAHKELFPEYSVPHMKGEDCLKCKAPPVARESELGKEALKRDEVIAALNEKLRKWVPMADVPGRKK
jgi:hypothetical protein